MSNDNKTIQNHTDVLDFLAGVNNEKRRADALTVLELFQTVVSDPPKMWGSSIVGFGTYHYRYQSGREGDFLVTGFSPRKANLTLYIMPGFDEYADAHRYDPQPLLEELGPYSTGKSCLYIKDLDAVDHDALRSLIKLSVQQMQYMLSIKDSYITEIDISLR